jgi:hypothetical protein
MMYNIGDALVHYVVPSNVPSNYSPTWTVTPSVFSYGTLSIGAEQQIEKEYDMIGLYDVVMVYGEDRKNLIINKSDGVMAASDEDAKIKSGLMARVDKSWDADYLTFIVNKIGDIKVKPKPSEVKNV